MIQLQQCCPCGVSLYYCGSKTALLGSKRHYAVDFVGLSAGSCRFFPAGVTVNCQKGGTSHDKEEDFKP